MKVIADSSSTRTEWVIVDGETVVRQAFTQGLNPYFQSRREISHVIRLELPPEFFRHRWEHVHFYGAGCANADKNKIMELSLVAQFKSPTTVESDLLGAARGLLVHDAGMACILGTGSNSCYYDGTRIVRHVKPLGFILGDEGSGAYLGKHFVADCLKEIAPADLRAAFYERFTVTPDEIMDAVYTNSLPNRTLSSYSFFLADFLDSEYVYNLVYDGIRAFFTRNIAAYGLEKSGLSFVGSVASTFSDVLRRVAADCGFTIARIEKASMPGLVQYHASADQKSVVKY